MNCPRCGSANSPETNFCLACGYNFTHQPVKEEPKPLSNIEEEILEIDEIIEEVIPQNNPQTSVMPPQQPFYQPPIVERVEPAIVPSAPQYSEEPKKSINIIPIIIGIIIIALIVGGIIFIPKLFSDKQSSTQQSSAAFFIKNKEGKYALFDKEGNKVTDFIYKSADAFESNTTVVKNDKGEYAIINDKNEKVVDFGVYSVITGSCAFYKVLDKKGDTLLLNSDGKVIKNITNSKILSHLTNQYVVLDNETNYDVLTYEGNIVTTINKKATAKEPTYNKYENHYLLHYDGKNYLYDIEKRQLLLSFSSNNPYCVGSSKDSRVIIYPCNPALPNEGYKIVENNKIILEKIDSNCLQPFYNNGQLYCTAPDKSQVILDDKGMVIADTSGKKLLDIKDYTREITQDQYRSVEFYKNNELIKTIDCRLNGMTKSFSKTKVYLLEIEKSWKCPDNSMGYEFYKEDGTSLNNEQYLKARYFFDDGLAIVKKDINYYFINSKGERISNKEYKAIDTVKGLYSVTTLDDKKALINSKEEQLYLGEKITVQENYATGTNADGTYALFDLVNGKLINNLAALPKRQKDYFYVKNGDKTEYYLYSGKKFLEL